MYRLPAVTAAMELDELRAILGTAPAGPGTWLSYVRNRVNYRHEMASWFPYAGHDARDLAVFARSVPPKAPAVLKAGVARRPILRFLDGCRFIVGLCWDMASEMASRCPSGRSFQQQGILHLERLIAQRRATG